MWTNNTGHVSSLTLLATQPRLRASEKKISSRFGGLKNSSYLCGVGDDKPTSLFDILDDTIREATERSRWNSDDYPRDSMV